MNRRHTSLWSPAIGAEGRVITYGHWGRPLLAFPSQEGPAWQYEERGMIDAVADLIEAGRVKVYAVDSFDSGSWYRQDVPLEARAQLHGLYEDWIVNQVVPFIRADTDASAEIDGHGRQLRRLPRRQLRAPPRRHLPARDLPERRLRRLRGRAAAERGDAVYFQNPADYVSNLGGEHLDWLRGRVNLLLIAGQGAWEDTTGALDSTRRFSQQLGEKGIHARARCLGSRRPARLARVARPDRASSPPLRMSTSRKHLIGLLLGTEEDWPAAFEHLLGRVGPIEHGGATHELTCERIFNEPFDLRYRPRYSLVIDRLGWWYTVPREWLKKVSLMDDVYLLNNPFTFQAMEKHSAYCAMMRLGLNVPETWLIPHKQPPANERFQSTAERYNLPFELEEIAERIGYPIYMKPFDGGQWVGVTRIRDADRAARRLRRLGRAADAPAGVGGGLRRLRAQPLDRRRDDGDALRARPADVRPLPGRPRLPQRPRPATRSSRSAGS